MRNYIYNSIKTYSQKNKISFHMPGHKGKAFFEEDVTAFDITEITNMDNLYNPDGIIKNSQIRAADLYGAKQSFFLTGGSTAGILAAILASVKEGEKILVARNCHRSVMSGVLLSGAKPVYLYPRFTKEGICAGIMPDDIKEAFLLNKDIKAIVITSPTYEGVVSEILSIAEIVHSYNAVLIVDEAHGAHFPFSDAFPKPSASCGADYVIIGLHKTMPVFGQCSMLLSNIENCDKKILSVLSMVQTSSPSYLFMSSIDLLMERLERGYYNFNEYVRLLNEFREDVSKAGANLLEKDIFDIDISKLVFFSSKPRRGMESLRNEFGIEMECCAVGHIIGISSIMDTKEDFAALLNGVSKTKELTEERQGFFKIPKMPETEEVLTPRQVSGACLQEVLIEDAIGFVSAHMIIIYPPGVAVIMPGERITKQVTEYIKYCLDLGIEVLGLSNKRVSIVMCSSTQRLEGFL